MMNYTALLVAAVVSFIIGMLWYSPVLFGKMYMKSVSHHEGGNKGGMAFMMVLQFIFGLVQVWALWWILTTAGVVAINPALMMAAVIWIGFTLVNAWSTQIWENRSTTAMWISAFCNLVCLAASAAILVSVH